MTSNKLILPFQWLYYQPTAPTLIFLLKEGSRKINAESSFLHENPVSYALLLHQPLALSKPISITTRPNFALPAENSWLILYIPFQLPLKKHSLLLIKHFFWHSLFIKKIRGKDSSFSVKIILFTHIVKVMINWYRMLDYVQMNLFLPTSSSSSSSVLLIEPSKRMEKKQ